MNVPLTRIMIVEDEAAHAEIIRRSLQTAGMNTEIQIAGSLNEYRKRISSDGSPDIALIDLNLPDGRAVEVLTSPPEAGSFPILIMTSYGSEQVAVETMKAGALDYIVKSQESFSEMPRIVARAMREWNLLRERKGAEEALSVSEVRYRRLFESAKDGILILDAETGMIVDVNPFLIEMLGYSHEQFIGRTVWELGLLKDVLPGRDKFLELQQKGYVRYEDLPLKTIHGRGINVEFVSNVYLVDHQKVIQCNIRDITDRKKAEEQIQKSLREKELLLKEIHHRVKNNLTVISSLLNLQAKQIKTKQQALEAFKESRDRVFAMSLVHEKLYHSQDFASVDIKSYLDDMAKQLIKMYRVSQDILLKLDIEDAIIDINRAIPCGLILNELITNAFKHAFPEGRKGEVHVVFRPFEETFYELIVSDNGIGIPLDFDTEHCESLGLHLVRLLTSQLDGVCSVSREKGATFRIQFPRIEA